MMQTDGLTIGMGILFLILGIGLLLEKGWAVQVTAALAFMLILSVVGVFFSYLDEYSLNLDDSIEVLVLLTLSLFCCFIVTYEVTMQLYKVNFIFFNRVKSILYWTAGLGFLGFLLSLGYMVMYVEGVYRGFVVAYGTVFFVGLGFAIGVIKFFLFKKPQSNANPST